MKKLILALFLFACNGIAQETDFQARWLPNVPSDSVLNYELFIIDNPDSMFLVNLDWENIQAPTPPAFF